MNTQYIVDKEGKKVSVVLPIEEYEELLEEIRDLAIIAERKEEKNVPFEEVIKNLKRDGLL